LIQHISNKLLGIQILEKVDFLFIKNTLRFLEPVDREELFGEGQYTEHEVQERKKLRDRFGKLNMFRKKEAEESIDKAPKPTSDL
jgi:hypothetical protein